MALQCKRQPVCGIRQTHYERRVGPMNCVGLDVHAAFDFEERGNEKIERRAIHNRHLELFAGQQDFGGGSGSGWP